MKMIKSHGKYFQKQEPKQVCAGFVLPLNNIQGYAMTAESLEKTERMARAQRLEEQKRLSQLYKN